MSNFSDDIHHIQALISSNATSNKSLGYLTLLHFQQHSADDPSSIQSLADCSHTLIVSIVSDVFDEDEEIAAQALKCLGFMIYHPSISATLQVGDASLVLESLAKLITTTKLKSACNLGAWCISVQQLGASFVATHFHSLLRAIVHALDNPMGSLSTTFEAIQAVMKLATQLSQQMRDSSHIWAPPICRRLLSIEKREKDASERCLLKIRSTVIPPSLDLSKVLVKDMKAKLLIGMKNLLDQGMKIQAIRAWGWFIHMIGSYALKNRHLVNDMLKIPERTFTDLDPQVQIATQVAWEALIDALVHCPILASEKNTPAEDNNVQTQHSLERHNCDIQAEGLSKSIRLIMTPLIGIMSSKCDISVQSSCLNTWCYLLHKLDTYVNEPSVIKLVLEPILKVTFQNGPDSKSIWQWDVCLDLLSDSISQKGGGVFYLSTNQGRPGICEIGHTVSGNCSWKQHPIRWLPWDISQLDFYLSMIFVLICQGSHTAVPHEHRCSVCDAALKLFILVLKGVKLDLENPSTNYDSIMCCLNSLLGFMKKVCEDLYSDGSKNWDLCHTSIQFVDAVTKELGPSVLGSPLYKFALDLKFIDNVQSADHNKHLKYFNASCISYMDKVSPMVYLIALYFQMLVQLTLNFPQSDGILKGKDEYFEFLFSSVDSLENFLTCMGFLCKYVQPIYLNVWIAVAQGLSHSIHDAKCKSLLEAKFDTGNYSSISHLLFYPLVAHSEVARVNPINASASLEKYLTSPERKPSLELIIQTWKSLYESLSTSDSCSAVSNFSEDLCSMFIGFLDEKASMLERATEINLLCKDKELDLLYLSGNFMICILEQIQTSELISETDRSNGGSDRKLSSGIENCLKFAFRYMDLLRTNIVTGPPPGIVRASRVFSALACFVICLHRKQDILHFIEIISCPLLQWLSSMEMQDQSDNEKLHRLWTEILCCLRRSHPPINFGSPLLKLHKTLFEKTLDHPSPSISEPTINFWNLTFGQQIILDYPPSLLPVLDKLSRNGKLKLQKRNLPFLERCHSHVEVNNDALQSYKVTTAKHCMTSKRVELSLDSTNHLLEQREVRPLSLKRKKLELTEHQREVRRAQQGRERDTGGHGPGIRTYTNVDFSQLNEDSQESQEVRDSEAIIRMLRKAM